VARKKVGQGGMIFLAALILTAVMTFFSFVAEFPQIIWVSLVTGALLGFYNITKKETVTYILAVWGFFGALTLVATSMPYFGSWLQAIAKNLAILLAPTTLLVTGKALFNILQKK